MDEGMFEMRFAVPQAYCVRVTYIGYATSLLVNVGAPPIIIMHHQQTKRGHARAHSRTNRAFFIHRRY
jgi:hypothetical protein